MKVWGESDRGGLRPENQDAIFAELYIAESGIETAILVVCDGMGGARAGGLAASIAADTFVKYMKPGLDSGIAPEKLITRCALLSNEAVYDKGRSAEEFRGMGTTLVAAVGDGDKMSVVNIGDSRCYLAHEGELIRVTKDHSLVEEMVDRGEIMREEAWRHPGRNYITRALGTDPGARCDMFEAKMTEGDFLLLCTDGLTNVVNPQELLFEIFYGGPSETAARRMIDIALSRGAPDNVSLVLFQR